MYACKMFKYFWLLNRQLHNALSVCAAEVPSRARRRGRDDAAAHGEPARVRERLHAADLAVHARVHAPRPRTYRIIILLLLLKYMYIM